MTEVDQVLAADGEVDYGLAVRVLQEVGSPEMGRKGRYRSFKHPDHAHVLTLRECPPGRCTRKYVRKLQAHVRLVLGIPQDAKVEATNEPDSE